MTTTTISTAACRDRHARRLPRHLPPMVAYTATMVLCTATIVPLLGLFPGLRHS
jgi:hypothetical protein